MIALRFGLRYLRPLRPAQSGTAIVHKTPWEAVKERARVARNAFSDMTVTVEEAIVEGPVVAVRATWRGTNTGPFMGREPTGRRVEVSGIMVWHFDDQGRIARNCSHVDYDGFLRQLEG